MEKLIIILIVATSFSVSAQAQGRRSAKAASVSTSTSSHPTFTYDLGASSGTYNGRSYSEINLGLSWYFLDYLVWRNSLFTRFGTNVDSASGLDTSARFVLNLDASENLGIGFFAGPGYRISNKENSGLFGEAGLTVKAAGLALGVGVKSLAYTSPGTNSDGTDRPKSDTTVFIIIAGGGAF